MKASELYEKKTKTKTPQYKFPVQVAVNQKWKGAHFQVVFTAIDGKEFSTTWLWNLKALNRKNQKLIDAALEELEKGQHAILQRSIQNELDKISRRKEIERKIDRLFDRH